ncbi:hypothetical protein [Halosimplex sp. J119]
MSVPLIEQGGASADSRGTEQTATAAETGPSVSFSMADGTEVVLTAEDLQLYLALIQTALLIYVTIKEVRS